MMRFFFSLTFLYAASICVLILYAISWYRSFAYNRTQKKAFPLVFGFIAALSIAFLFVNMHPPRTLRTYSNLDHHFLRHDGFQVNGRMELGGTDTVNYEERSFNRFIFSSVNNDVTIHSPYSEEPFYVSLGKGYQLATTSFPATGHELTFHVSDIPLSIRFTTGSNGELRVGDKIYPVSKSIRRGISAFHYFSGSDNFMHSSYYTDEAIVKSLRNIFILRGRQDDEKSPLYYYFSGKLRESASLIHFNGKPISQDQLAFSITVPDKAIVTWGLGLTESSRKQFRFEKGNQDSFRLINRFPVSYPLTEEKGGASLSQKMGKEHDVMKFLVSSSMDIPSIPAVFREGFLFSPGTSDSTLHFSPLLLSYRKLAGNRAPSVRVLANTGDLPVTNNQFLVPSQSGEAQWMFSIVDTRQWQLGNRIISPKTWELIIFAILGFYCLVILGSWYLNRDAGWVWQVLSCVVLLLLTTRIFLYWRYKTFPPFEGMDLPSLQQLNSPWNFLVIIISAFVLAFVLGFSGTSSLQRVRLGKWNLPALNVPGRMLRIQWDRKLFFIAWASCLSAGAGTAVAADFDPAVCRYLAIVLILVYFYFLFISYKYSPLVKPAQESWWSLRTGNSTELLVSNPVKVLLSVSLLGLFVLVDIGFAILFLNFMLFNEAFLCINYSIAGLSAGSRTNARTFGIAGTVYMLLFIFNLTYGPYVFRELLDLPTVMYAGAYLVFAAGIAFTVVRLLKQTGKWKRRLIGFGLAMILFAVAFLFFPRERILGKAAMTRYRIDVMTMPVSAAIEGAYADGKNYTPVIRAAQNQWFINTFIDKDNNPGVNRTGFNLLQHAPQHKGAKYNAQATDLVASRFLIAEHGKWSVLLFVLLLMLPAVLVASFYKLYPDFTNRVNNHYAVTNTAFSLLNYLLVAALLVILAATGRYIFFGQDLPFGSILSKQSILFPAILIGVALLLFRKIKPEQYSNRKKFIPGLAVLGVLSVMMFVYRPAYNRNKTFGAGEIAKEMDGYIQARLQPLVDHFTDLPESAGRSNASRDKMFTDSLRKLIAAGTFSDAGHFLQRELEKYSRGSFTDHLDEDRLLFLDLNSGSPKLAINDNFFRIDPPPHLQQYWSGNVYSDTTNYHISVWRGTGKTTSSQLYLSSASETAFADQEIKIKSSGSRVILVNVASQTLEVTMNNRSFRMDPRDSLTIPNPARIIINGPAKESGKIIQVEPDAFMKNYYVNGSRFYVYPLRERFIWARNFAENVATNHTADGLREKNAFVSVDVSLMDSLTSRIAGMMKADPGYGNGASYGICIADGNGRLMAMADHIKGVYRPDPNDKAAFNTVVHGENGLVSQSLLRQQIGNVNMLRMNPGPGSTLKPIIFAAVASQLNMDWNAFAAEGFSIKQEYFGGEKVAEYDFEKNNGRINTVRDYLRLSDNYYHANLLLLGSYSQQDMKDMLSNHFATRKPRTEYHWPWFQYKGKNYWLDGFQNWPGFANGKANFGSDSSFVSMGLVNNFGIHTNHSGPSVDGFNSGYDSILFRGAARRSGFLIPEFALFDQKAKGMNHDKPNELFLSAFRGHVKGSSQVMMPPVKMVEAFGRLVNQDRAYSITLDPYATSNRREPFVTASNVSHQQYLELMKESVFGGMHDALFRGTAAGLGSMLINGSPYYYYAKTGTTGDDKMKEKSKLFVIIISKMDISDPGFNFRNNKFYTVYFTSQGGPPKQNEKFQAQVIRMIEQSPAFRKYMGEGDQ